MLLIPKKYKYKKVRKVNIKFNALTNTKLLFGSYGILALEAGYIHAKQLEAIRQTINRHLNRKGKIWTIVFPDYGVTKRPTQIRIGKGTGKIQYWVHRVRPGKMLFEVDGISLKVVLPALISGVQKFPFKVKIIL
jgi:large subunit ribosomal protein L16